jgi:hypothetical protein
LEQYKDQIKELEERGIPATPPKVRVPREKDTTESAENIAETIHKMA